MKNIIFIFSLIFSNYLYSQDIIYPLNGNKINCQITSVTGKLINFKTEKYFDFHDSSLNRFEVSSFEMADNNKNNQVLLEISSISKEELNSFLNNEVYCRLISGVWIYGKLSNNSNNMLTLSKDSVNEIKLSRDDLATITTSTDRKLSYQSQYSRLKEDYETYLFRKNLFLFSGVSLLGVSVLPLLFTHQFWDISGSELKNPILYLCILTGTVFTITGIVEGMKLDIIERRTVFAKYRLETMSFNLNPYFNPYNNSYGLAFNIRF